MPIFANLLSMFIFGAYAIVPHIIHLPPLVITWLFGLSGLIFLSPIGIKYNSFKDLIDIKIFIISLIMVMDIFFLISGYKYISVGVVTSLHYLGPVIATLLAPIMLKQKYNRKVFYYILISFLGALFMCFKFIHNFNAIIIYGLLFGIGSGFTLAGDILFQNGYMKEKKVHKTNNDLINAAATVFKYNLYIVLILTIPVMFILPHIKIENYGKVFIWGVMMQGIAMVLVNYSSINLSANYLGLFGYTEIFWSFFYGYTILKQKIDVYEIIGVLILIVASYMGYMEKRKTEVKEEGISGELAEVTETLD
jgi:drug/metabolite transporter (DMT)-like permease